MLFRCRVEGHSSGAMAMISKRKKGSKKNQRAGAIADEVADEVAIFEASLESQNKVQEEGPPLRPGVTHVRAHGTDGVAAIARRRFSALPEKK